MVFLEDAEHLVLTDKSSEFRGVFTCRYAQQQTVEVVFQSEQVYLRRVGQQCPIVVVLVTVNVIVGGEESSCTLQQLHLRQRPGLLEHADGFFRRCLVTVDGYGSINDVLHLLSQSGGIVRGYRPTYLQVHVIAIADGNVDNHLAWCTAGFVEQFVGGLT